MTVPGRRERTEREGNKIRPKRLTEERGREREKIEIQEQCFEDWVRKVELKPCHSHHHGRCDARNHGTAKCFESVTPWPIFSVNLDWKISETKGRGKWDERSERNKSFDTFLSSKVHTCTFDDCNDEVESYHQMAINPIQRERWGQETLYGEKVKSWEWISREKMVDRRGEADVNPNANSKFSPSNANWFL